MVKLTKFQKGVSNLGAKVFNMLPSYIKMESDNPKKFKMALQKFLYENSFYSLDIFQSRKVKDKYTFVVFCHIKITCFPSPQLPTCIINQFVFTTT